MRPTPEAEWASPNHAQAPTCTHSGRRDRSFGALHLDRLPVIAFDRDGTALLPEFSSPFVYWRLPSGHRYCPGDLECSDVLGSSGKQGACFVLLLCSCGPRHPALAASHELAAGRGRTKQDEVWFVFLLSPDKLSRLMLSDQRSPELRRLLLDAVPRSHLYVPSTLGLVIPEYLASDYASQAPRGPQQATVAQGAEKAESLRERGRSCTHTSP
jgi:hypothetical protein